MSAPSRENQTWFPRAQPLAEDSGLASMEFGHSLQIGRCPILKTLEGRET